MSDELVHELFGLSYAQYFAVSRTALQSMPADWQRRFVKCIEELSESVDWVPQDGNYHVTVRGHNGKFTKDPLADYERGRRRLPLKEAAYGLAFEKAVEFVGVNYGQLYQTDAPRQLDFLHTERVCSPKNSTLRAPWRYILAHHSSQLDHYERCGYTIVDVCGRCMLGTCEDHG